MAKFIQVVDSGNGKRLVNIDHISDIYENFIYFDSPDGMSQSKLSTEHTYEELISKLQQAGAEIYF